MKALIVDALAHGRGRRLSTLDVIGAGPRTLAGVLEALGVEYLLQPASRYLEEPHPQGFDLLLVSAMSGDLPTAARVVKRWKREQGGPAVLGGPAASDPWGALRKTGVDVAVVGEGEYALSELVDSGLDPTGVRGAAYWDGGEVRLNPLRPVQPPTVFSEYPPSTKAVTQYPLYRSARVYVEVVRGCSNYHRARLDPRGCEGCERCTRGRLEERYTCPRGIPPGCGYCSVPSLHGPPRSRGVELVVGEAEELLGLGVRRLVLSAPGFLDYMRERLVHPHPLTDPRSPEPNYQALEELLSSLTSLPRVEAGEASVMVENLKPSLVTPRAAELLGKYLAGTPVSIGLETGCPHHSRAIGRPNTPEEALQAVRLLKAAGLRPYVYVIHGLPGQTRETSRKTEEAIEKSAHAGAERVILYRFQSLPASAFSGQPSGPPSTRDEDSKAIAQAAERINREARRGLVGQRIWVVAAERYRGDPERWVAYPLKHGPVVLVGGALREGALVQVRVTGLLGRRMVCAQPLTPKK